VSKKSEEDTNAISKLTIGNRRIRKNKLIVITLATSSTFATFATVFWNPIIKPIISVLSTTSSVITICDYKSASDTVASDTVRFICGLILHSVQLPVSPQDSSPPKLKKVEE
jgi:hypothetical protein